MFRLPSRRHLPKECSPTRPTRWQRPLRAGRRAYPQVEALEDRTLPAVNLGPPLVTPDGISLDGAVAADFNDDGKLDLALRDTATNAVHMLLGNGDGSFRLLPAAGQVAGGQTVVGDFNGDGTPDLAFLDPQDLVNGPLVARVLLGKGDGRFQPPLATLVGPRTLPYSPAVADFNGDGKPDLVWASPGPYPGIVTVALGAGDGTFSGVVSTPTSTISPHDLHVGDFNGDGKPDLDVEGDFLVILLGKGDGTFQTLNGPPVTNAFTPPSAPVVGDLNSDGKLDLAEPALAFAAGGGGAVISFLGRGDGTFVPASNPPANPFPGSLITGDFNGDGKLDLAEPSDDPDRGGVSVILGNGDGTFAPAVLVRTGPRSPSVVAGDFNGDGNLDLVALYGNKGVNVLLNPGDVTLANPVTLLLGTTPSSFALADFNGDARPDLALADATGNRVAVESGNGDGTFQPAHFFAAGTNPASVVAGDFNGDGRQDLAVADRGTLDIASQTYAGGGLSMLLGNGDGTFQAAQPFAVGPSPAFLAAADFNGDGQPDLAVGDSQSATVAVLPGLGDGTFGPATTLTLPGRLQALLVADFNGDGRPDLVVGHVQDPLALHPRGGVSILAGNGDGTFAAPRTLDLPGNVPDSLAVGDFNRDGKPDLAALFTFEDSNFEQGRAVRILLGGGDGALTVGGAVAIPPISAGEACCMPTGTTVNAVAAADLNGDGNLDLVLGASSLPPFANPGVSVAAGNGDGTFSMLIPFARRTGVTYLTAADVTGDGRPDVVGVDASDGSVAVLPNRAESPARGLVRQWYRDLLQREPDEAGLTFFSGALETGRATGLQVIQQIQASPEYRALGVQQIYEELLSRPADETEVGFWLNFLAQGGTLPQIQALVYGTDRFFDAHLGTMTSFVQVLYREVLGRDPTDAELQMWVQIPSSSTNRTALAYLILTSPEAMARQVQALFLRYLRHAPDGNELAFFLTALQQGATADQVAAVLAGSQEYAAGVNADVHLRYVARLYRDLLQRDGRAGEIAYWTGLLNQGRLAPGQVVQQFEASDEYHTRAVQQAFATLLHRPATAQEVTDFQVGLAAGGTLRQLRIVLAGSDEYFQKRGGGTNDGFVQALYADVLGRAPGAAEQAAATQALAQGAARADVAAALFDGDEYRKDFVEQLFAEALHRAANAGDLAFWAGLLGNGLSEEQVRAEVLSSDEYFTRL